MKSYAIYDKGLERTSAIGYLFYYEKSKSFIIELCTDLDEWEAPLLFQGLVNKKIYTIPRDISLMWVRERVIPSGRQNLGSILRNHKLKDYNEMTFLALAKGKCSQDQCYIKEISEKDIPLEIKGRMQKNIRECFPTEGNQLVCLFKDDEVQMVDLSLLCEQHKDISHVLANRELLDTAKIGPGGYSIIFNDSIEIEVCDLRKIGQNLPLRLKDFLRFINRNIVDTTEACEMLQCSRQNLSYLVKEDKIKPTIYGTKENLYLRGDIEKLMNE